MMKKFFQNSGAWLLVMLPLVLAVSCEQDDSEEKLEQEQRLFDLYMSSTFRDTIPPPSSSGLYHIPVEEGTGLSPDDEDWLLVNYVGYIIPEEQVVDTYLENVARSSDVYVDAAIYGPLKMKTDSRTRGLTEGLRSMKEGGKSIFCFTSELGYGSTGVQLMRKVPSFKSLRYEVELLEVIGDIEAYEQAKLLAYVDTIPGADTIHDPFADAVMYYVIDEPNNGSLIKADSVVELSYRGYLLDGREFDASEPGEPYEFKVDEFSDERSPIPGWHQGVKRFRGGEKGRLIIPYPLAYGEGGSVTQNVVTIQPYETLVFDIEVVSVNGDTGDPDPEPDLPE